MKIKKDTEVFQCDLCEAMFFDKEKLAKHRIECEKASHKCPSCEGKGYIIDTNTYDYCKRIMCHICNGTGKV